VDRISLTSSIDNTDTGVDDLSTRLAHAFVKRFDSLGDHVASCVEKVTAAEKIAAVAENVATHSVQMAEHAQQSAEASVAAAEKVAEHSLQDVLAEMQQGLNEASSELRCEIQKVEHELTGASSHLRCEFQSELHDVERRVAEKCASEELQLHEKTTLLVEEAQQQASWAQQVKELREDVEDLRAEMDEVHESEAEASRLDGDLRKNLEAHLETMLQRSCEEQARSLESLESSAENNHNVLTESLQEIERCEDRARQRFTEELREIAEKVQGAGRTEVTNIGKQLREMRQELTTAASQWRTSASDTAQTLGALTANCQSMNSELKELQSLGLSHEWRIPKCMSEDSGVWLDSPSFSLGPLGQLELRLYPRGFRGGDGQCAVGLYAAGVEGLRPVPFQLDLAIQGLRRRAVVLHEDNVGMLWLVQDLGKLEGHLVKTEDLTISVELLGQSWASASGATSGPRAMNRPYQSFSGIDRANI
jgi:hypothetical protein